MIKVFQKISAKMTILKDLIRFFWEQKLWWLIPMIIVLVLVGLLVVFSQSSTVAPFIYVLF